jgi:hypothetical protein
MLLFRKEQYSSNTRKINPSKAPALHVGASQLGGQLNLKEEYLKMKLF